MVPGRRQWVRIFAAIELIGFADQAKPLPHVADSASLPMRPYVILTNLRTRRCQVRNNLGKSPPLLRTAAAFINPAEVLTSRRAVNDTAIAR